MSSRSPGSSAVAELKSTIDPVMTFNQFAKASSKGRAYDEREGPEVLGVSLTM